MLGGIVISCSDNLPPPITRNDLYTNAFVKDFGEFSAQRWDEAKRVGVTIKTSRPTSVSICADINGTRYLFANMGNVEGSRLIPMSLPKDVENLIVEAYGNEYNVKVGGELDLTRASRAGEQISHEVSVTIDGDVRTAKVGDFTVKCDKAQQRILQSKGSFIKQSFNKATEVNYVDYPFTYGSSRNFNNFGRTTIEDYGTKQDSYLTLYKSSYCYVDKQRPFLTIYPYFWRKNQHGEDDYLLGVCIFDSENPSIYAMMDLIDVKQAIHLKKNGQTEWQTPTTQPYDCIKGTNTSKTDLYKFDGVHLEFTGLDAFTYSNRAAITFYVKSGLKDTSREGFGRECAHISFQNAYHNRDFWSNDNYWDLQLKDISYTYCGAIFCSKTITANGTVYDYINGNRLDSFNDNYYAILPLGFMSQPDGVQSADADFCDCVFLINYEDANTKKEQPLKGEAKALYPWYLASEDLGGSFDWDFNDLVVNVYDVTTDYLEKYNSKSRNFRIPSKLGRRITVIPKAAGGTMPIYLMYDGAVRPVAGEEAYLSDLDDPHVDGTYMIGTELHRWLGAPDHTKPLNVDGTDFSYEGCAVSFDIPIGKNDNFNVNRPPSTISADDTPMRGFWVLVDPEDELKLYETNPDFDRTPLPDFYSSYGSFLWNQSQSKNVYTPFDGELGPGGYRVTSPTQDKNSIAPQMIMCHYKWMWPRECVNINDAWTWFADWVNGTRERWHNADEDGERCPYHNHLVCEPPTPKWTE